MKPMIILPPNTMSEEDIKQLRDNDLCIVVSEDPSLVKFVDPIPCLSSRTQIEDAAIQLCRKVLNPGCWNSEETRKTLTAMFIDILVKGSSLDPKPARDEIEKKAYDDAHLDECRKIAREDARAEAAAKKAAKAAKK